jgi:predicted nucleotidyltransferase
VTQDVRRALERLVDEADTGALARLCRRHAISLLVVFGSATHPDAEDGGPPPGDLDLAVRFEPDARRDLLTLLDDLYQLIGLEAVDLMVLDEAGPVARERALVGGRPLHQGRPGAFANEQIAAIMERMETEELRRIELELMAR